MTTKLFSELGLSPELLKAIDKLGFEQAAPIQAEAIPVLMQGRDVVGQSQTGSGKTAAFAIPALEKTDPRQRTVQVLILCPTRELAVQVSEEVFKLAAFKRGIHALPIYGGQSYDRQFYGLRQGAQIVIGTPGRLMDHLRRGTLHLDKVTTVILDEADVMLDMGFREDIEFILQAVPAERQTVFFAATMPRAIRELIQRYARDPQNVSIEQKTVTVPTVEQLYYEVDRRFKVELLTRLIDLHDINLGIIFCNTKRMVDDLADHLEAQGYSADRLHGDMSQAQRDRVMNKFRKSGLEFLVATDVAARGIDVDDVEVVFNYDLPYDVEDYVHRIGRTGRAGRSGRAISFVAGREVFQIRNIERYTRTRIQPARVPTVAEVEDARQNLIVDQLRATLKARNYQRQDHLLERLLEEGFTSTDIASALLHHLQGGEPAPTPVGPRAEGWGGPREPRTPQPDPKREPHGDRPESKPARPPRPAQSQQPDRRPGKAPGDAGRANRDKPLTPGQQKRDTPTRPARTDKRLTPRPPHRSSATAQPNCQKPEPSPSPKHSRRTPPGQTRLHVNLGKAMDIVPIDIVNTVSGETGLPGSVVGTVDVRERHLFADVAAEHAKAIIAKLNRCQIKGHKVKVKRAQSGSDVNEITV